MRDFGRLRETLGRFGNVGPTVPDIRIVTGPLWVLNVVDVLYSDQIYLVSIISAIIACNYTGLLTLSYSVPTF